LLLDFAVSDTRAVNLRKEPYDVYIGRAGKGKDGYFGNPIKRGEKCSRCKKVHRGAGSTLGCYERYLDARIEKDTEFAERVRGLYGKRLGCFCHPKPCHGDILAKRAVRLHEIHALATETQTFVHPGTGAAAGLIFGECVEQMALLPDNSVDCIVCDPPYAMTYGKSGGFMGKDFDKFESPWHFQRWCERWGTEALRVLKPGGHIAAFGGNKSHHRLACGLEDAGFDPVDVLDWCRGQSMALGTNISKAIDKMGRARSADIQAFAAAIKDARLRAGMSRVEVSEAVCGSRSGACWNWESGLRVPTGAHWNKLVTLLSLPDSVRGMRDAAERVVVGAGNAGFAGGSNGRAAHDGGWKRDYNVTLPATSEAKKWEGWNTTLRTLKEPIILMRKPLSEGTYAANVLRWGTGAMNIDACRVATSDTPSGSGKRRSGLSGDDRKGAAAGMFAEGKDHPGNVTPKKGRWPPNFLLSHVAPTEQLRWFCHNCKVRRYKKDKRCPDCNSSKVRGKRMLVGGCKKVGTHRVKATSMHGTATAKRGTNALAAAQGCYTEGREKPVHGYADKDGKETVDKWECVEGCAVAAIDAQSGQSKSAVRGPAGKGEALDPTGANWRFKRSEGGYTDKGGASRFYPVLEWSPEYDVPFFYTPKANNKDRHGYLPGEEKCTHPTIKSVALCRWLVRLLCPPGGIVLDPFMGTGPMGVAAVQEGMRYIGIEMLPEYFRYSVLRARHATGLVSTKTIQRTLI